MEVLNIASYLQVESVVKFCLSYLDCAKEQNVTLKPALSSPYDTCLYKVLNESISKKFEPNVITSTSPKQSEQDKSDNKSKKLPQTSSSSDTVIINIETKEKNFYVNNANQKGQTLSSSQMKEVPFKSVSNISSDAVQVKYIIEDDDDDEDDTKPDIEQHNPSPHNNFIASENIQTFSLAQDDGQSCSPDSLGIGMKNNNRNALMVSTNR